MRKLIDRKRSSLTKAMACVAAVLGMFAADGLAQHIKNTDYSPDKVLKSNARVNPSTLAMELSIPLIGFPGRAGNGKGAVLSYSSKVWGMDNYGTPWENQLGMTINDIRPRYAKDTAAGWSSNLGTVRLVFSADVYRNQGAVPGEFPVDGQIFVLPLWETPPDGDIFYVKRVQVMMPDGSSHEMRASDAPVNCGTVNGTGCNGMDFTGTYLSVDGSRMRLESGTQSSVSYMPDGGRYLFGGTTGLLATAHTHLDVHGNKSAYNATTRAWTDTMGRVIADPMPDNFGGTLDEWGSVQKQTVGVVEAEFPGFGTAAYEVDIEWAELEDVLLNPSDPLEYTGRRSCSGSGSTPVDPDPYLFEDGSHPNTRLCKFGGLFNPVVLKKITLPNGQAYEFKYNVFGEIIKIIYPTGAYERFMYGVHESLSPTGGPYDAANRGVTDRWVSEKGGGSDEIHWNYAVSLSGGYHVTTTAPDGSYTEQYIYMDSIVPPTNPYGFRSVYAGRPYEEHNDTPGNIWVKSRQQIDENNWAESTTFYDNLGRAIKTRTKDLQGDVVSQVKFDNFGRVEKTSNAYRVDANGNATETVYWSKLRYDERNRVAETFAPAPEGQTGNSLGTAEFGISTLPNLIGTYAVAIDPSGRKSRAISGIYGMMRVDEATGKGGTIDQDLGTLANPAQPTYYNYNIKGELTKITQGIQNRYFMYDSLGRLIRVRQPEQTSNPNLTTAGNPENNQWTAAYSYDVLGNVVSVTDAKNITITNLYDKAGRTVKRTYSDGTPEVQYFYDGKGLPQVPQFSKGSLTKVTSSVSEDRFTSFDNHGRLLASQQFTDGQTYNFGYEYNLSGGLIEQTYPSGRIVRNFLDADGGLSLVNTKAANGPTQTVASNFDYSATGSVKKMKLGNGLWETAAFNELQQLTQVGLGTTQTNNDLFKVDYEYGELNGDGTTVDTVKNIGNIAKTTTTIPTTSFVQTFKYDSINRLTEAVEKTGSNQNWKQTFGYDRFGNRTQFYQIVGSTELPTNNVTKPTVDQTNNRFTTGQGYVYDFNGNLVQDAEGRTFTFNGDDKQTEARDTATNQIIGQYFYDGSGARVKKVIPSTGETTIFVYDAGGALAAEYSTIIAPPQEAKTSYLTTDHLGSPRVITDGSGQVISRRDFMPFGEELGAGVGPRTEPLKYSVIGSDNIRKRFTGYEKDDETGLDFAEARMYQNKHGRFTAVDPLLASANAANPQTFNRYIYTGNNPANYTDPSGLNWCQNNSTNITTFTGADTPCEKGFTDLNDQERTVGATGCFTDNFMDCHTAGSQVRFNANGTTTLISPPTTGDAAPERAVQVRATQEEIITTTAAEISTNITPRGALPLPCLGDCGTEPLYSNPLTQGASADEVLDATQTALEFIGLIPGLEPADAASGIISLARGDNEGFALSVASMVPVFGTAAGATKIGRRLNKAADVVNGNSKASTKAQHAYEVFDTATENVVKTGVSGGPVTKSGKSYRANNQVSKMNKSNPEVYDSRIVKTIPAGPNAREKILDFEKKNARKHRNTLLRKFHQRP